MYNKYIKIRPEHKFAVPMENNCWGEYKTFNTIGEAVFFIARDLFGKNYTFIAVKDHPYNKNFTAEFEYINEAGEKKIRRKVITIPNYEEVERKYSPISPRRIKFQSWDAMRARLFEPDEKWVYNF